MSNAKSYSEEFKEMAVKKLVSSREGLRSVADDLGLPRSTLFGWKEKYANSSFMRKKNEKQKNKQWSPEEKLQSIVETSTMDEHELGEYLRKHGLHSSDLDEWRNDFYDSQKSAGRPKKDPELYELRKKEKKLKRDLNRKDKALAEMSARVILLKKSQEIFGELEDEE